MNDTKKQFVTSFWNYVPSGVIDAKKSTDDWAELGMNTPMTCFCQSDEDYEYILKNLDAANEKGMKLIICDKRTLWYEIGEIGEDEYRRRVKAAAEKFASHPAFYAFHVGDEPAKVHWADMLKAVKIVKEYARPFINFLPFFEEDFEKNLGTNHAGYADMLEKAVKETGLGQLCYDCYFQMFENNRDDGIGYYFHNLNMYRALSEKTGVDFWTTLLSVGHWAYRVPGEDDIRWQISTACAHGAKGIFWFYIYGRLLESSYRQSPFDQYYNKTETYERLARQMRIFNENFAKRFANSTLKEVYHVGKTYGGTPLYTPGCVEGLFFKRAYGEPMIVSKFEGFDGKTFLAIVNNSQEKIERIDGEYKGKQFILWFAPGQTYIVE